MISIWSLVNCVVAFITLYLTHWIYRWRYPKCSGILPPGSSGLPLIGETHKLMMPAHFLGLSPFLKTRLDKYGPLFRTNIAFRNVVVSADAQVNYSLLVQEGKVVEQWYLDSFGKVFQDLESGPDGKDIHKYIRDLTLRHFGVDCVKIKLLTEIHQSVCRTLESWSVQDTIEVKSATAAVLLQFSSKISFSCDPEKSLQLLAKFSSINNGFMSLPLNIPGTAYHKMLKDKKQLTEIFSGIIRDRLASTGNCQGDFLDHILEDMGKKKFITLDFIANFLFVLTFASMDSISWTCALALHLISENPLVLEELTAEHEEIIKKRDNSSSPITWQEFKSMTFTLQVIREILRMGSVIPGFLRRAKKDIVINGYTIPAGWAIMIATTPVHFNPDIFKDPLKFNPWRWKELPPDVISKNFTPFGGGMKQCAGSEYTRAFLCIFLHVLVTKYRWKKVGGGEFIQNPILQFKNGLHIEVSKKHN